MTPDPGGYSTVPTAAEIRPFSDLRLVCVFNPAPTGRETHDADGSFPPPTD